MKISSEIKQLQSRIAAVKASAESVAPAMIDDLMLSMSLRQIARRLKRSPTYISHVKNGECRISCDTFFELEKLWCQQQCNE